VAERASPVTFGVKTAVTFDEIFSTVSSSTRRKEA
jgi:hypothetical protein